MPDVREKLLRTIQRRMPTRAVEAARMLEAGKLKPGHTWSTAIGIQESARWSDHPSFLLSGMKGTGKTTVMAAIGCRETMKRRNVWYLPVTRLARILKSHRDAEPQMSQLEDCDLLLIDELHRFETLPAWLQSEAVALIDHRYGNLRQTGAAGTLPEDGLGGVLGWEIMERFDILINSDEDSYR